MPHFVLIAALEMVRLSGHHSAVQPYDSMPPSTPWHLRADAAELHPALTLTDDHRAVSAIGNRLMKMMMKKLLIAGLLTVFGCSGALAQGSPLTSLLNYSAATFTANGKQSITGPNLNAAFNLLTPVFASMGSFDGTSGAFTLPLANLQKIAGGTLLGNTAGGGLAPPAPVVVPPNCPLQWSPAVGFSCLSVVLPSNTNIIGIICDGTTDNYTVINNAATVAALTGANLVFPPGQCVINMSTGRASIVIRGGLQGNSTGSYYAGSPSTTGTTLLIRGTSNSPFSLSTGAILRDFTMVWPDQTNPSAPIAYPPAITLNGASTVLIQNVELSNAYVGVDILPSSGFIWINKCRFGTFGPSIRGATIAAEDWFTDNSFSYSWGYNFYNNLGQLAAWQAYYAAHSIGFSFLGVHSDAQVISNNVFVGGNIGIQASYTGADSFLWATVTGNHFDGTFQGIVFSGTTRPNQFTVTGNTYEYFGTQASSSFVALGMSGSTATFDMTIASNRISVSSGSQLSFSAPSGQVGSISISGNTIYYPGFQQPTGSYNLVYLNVPSVDISMSGNTIDGGNLGNSVTGVFAQNVRTLALSGGNILRNLSLGVNLGTVAQAVIVGNGSFSLTTPLSGSATKLVNISNGWN